MRRGLVGFVIAAAALLGPAAPVWAHDGQGGSASDYQVKFTGFEGGPSGFTIQFTKLGQYIELTRTTAKEIYVLGYEGEQYLRIDDGGVWENIKSPAHFLNLDRYASTNPPADASKSVAPQWIKRNGGNTAVWHDHRTHWMSPIPPPEIQANPGVERAVPGDHRLPLTVDGRSVAALISITWIPPPNRTMWLAITSLGGCAIVYLLDRRRSLIPWCAVVVALAAMGVHGGGVGGTVVTAVAGAVAVVAALVPKVRQQHFISLVVAAVAVGYGFIRIDSFSHALVSGTLTDTLARVAVAVSIGAGCAVVGAVAIEKVTPQRTAPHPVTLS